MPACCRSRRRRASPSDVAMTSACHRTAMSSVSDVDGSAQRLLACSSAHNVFLHTSMSTFIKPLEVSCSIVDTHTHTRLTALFPALPRWAGTRKVKPIWILLKQETVSGSDISWAICKSAPRSRQITMPAPHHTLFFTGRMPFLPTNQPTVSKHWRHIYYLSVKNREFSWC